MSQSHDKIKTSKRRYQEEVKVKKQLVIAKQKGYTHDNKVIREPHRLAKHHLMDCGTPGCILCGNPRRNKLLKSKDKLTIQERKFNQNIDLPNTKHNNGLSDII